MSKKVFIFIILFMILTVIGIIFGTISIYRIYNLQNIYGKLQENVLKDNYYMKTTIHTNDTDSSTTETYYRDGVGKLVANNGIYSWTDGEYAYMIDETNKVAYILDIKKENLGLVSYNMFANLVPGYTNNLFSRFLFAANLKNTVKKEKDENGNLFYVIGSQGENSKKTIWLNEKATPVKGEVAFKDGTKIRYEYEMKFNSVMLKDIDLPNIDDYKVIDAESNEVIKNSEQE